MPDPGPYERYLQELQVAAKQFADLETAPESGGGRLGAMAALKATITFLDSTSGNTELQTPLLRLFLALLSAEEGSTDSMLKPVSLGKKGPILEHERAQRGYLAAAMELVMADGIGLDDAARWVARHAKGLGVYRKVKSSAWEATRDWRDAANAGNINSDIDTAVYRTAVLTLKQMTKTELFVAGNGKKIALNIIVRARQLGNPKS